MQGGAGQVIVPIDGAARGGSKNQRPAATGRLFRGRAVLPLPSYPTMRASMYRSYRTHWGEAGGGSWAAFWTWLARSTPVRHPTAFDDSPRPLQRIGRQPSRAPASCPANFTAQGLLVLIACRYRTRHLSGRAGTASATLTAASAACRHPQPPGHVRHNRQRTPRA